MTIEVTLAKVRDAMKATVAARGEDYQYKAHFDSCRNVQRAYGDDGQWVNAPGCMVGDALHRLGVPLDSMSAPGVNDATADDLLSALIHNEVVVIPQGEDSEVIGMYLLAAQGVQDKDDRTWGEALREAEDYAVSVAVTQ